MGERSKILAIDDDPSMLEYLQEVLKRERYEVLTALTGKEGLKKFSDSAPNLVLLDLKLSGENGIDILEKIRELNPLTPVAILTGYGYDAETVTEAKKKGATEYILKTAPLATLSFKIRKLLKGQNGAQYATSAKEAISNVLVVDDDEGICNLLRDFLERSGYKVFITTDPHKAVEIVRKEKIALVFLDVIMPKLNGIEVLGDIKAANKNIPVTMISGAKDDDIIATALKAGAVDYITKPFSLDQIRVVTLKNIMK